MKSHLSAYEQYQTQEALKITPSLRFRPPGAPSEYTERDIPIGRAREQQLIAEAERHARAHRRPLAGTDNRIFPDGTRPPNTPK